MRQSISSVAGDGCLPCRRSPCYRADVGGVGAVVGRLGLVSSQDWAEAVAARFGLERVTADDLPKEPILTDQLSVRFLRHASVLPVQVRDGRLWLAMVDPSDVYAPR